MGMQLPCCSESSLVATLRHWANEELFFQFDGKLIDLGRHDKIVYRQAAEIVRGEFDGHITIAPQVQVGVMVLRLGDPAHAVEEIEGAQKILGYPFAADAFAVHSQ